MRDFQDTFETRKRSFRSAFSTCMDVLLIRYNELNLNNNIFKMLSVAKDKRLDEMQNANFVPLHHY